MPKIIVSYRRSDSSATAGRIYDHLVDHFGAGSVFMDVDAIPFGTDFRTHIRSELLLSDIVLAVIGPRWRGVSDDGKARIDDEADPVRVEVETALRAGITIVPVLIDGAPMPAASDLPEPLRDLAFLNAAPVDMGRDFRPHMDRLARSLDMIVAQRRRDLSPAAATAAGAVLTPPVAPSRPATLPPGPTSQAPASSRKPVLVAAAAIVLAAGLGTAGWLGWDRSRAAPSVAPAVAHTAALLQAPTPVPPTQPVSVTPVAPQAPAPVVVAAAPLNDAAPAAEPKGGQSVAPTAPSAVPSTSTSPSQSRRSKSHGSFAWYELWTTNASSAQNFYRSVIGWDARTTGSGDAAYSLLLAGQVPVAGLATLPAGTVAQGARPAWVGYVTVTDVDASAAQVKELGGTVYRAPADVPGIGRYALVTDPQGAFIVLFKGLVDTPPTSAVSVQPGFTGWRELYTGDREGAFDFYAKMFGWTKADAPDVTTAGYQLFASGGDTLGGIAAKPGGMPIPYWTFYFQVDGLTAALGRAQAAGGTIIVPPVQLRSGSWVAQGLDPQGAAFALMSAKR